MRWAFEALYIEREIGRFFELELVLKILSRSFSEWWLATLAYIIEPDCLRIYSMRLSEDSLETLRTFEIIEYFSPSPPSISEVGL